MAKSQAPLNITVLSGGPDAEAVISRKSGRHFQRLRTAGHHVHELDLPTEDPSSPLHQIPKITWFPGLHGPWGEGGARCNWWNSACHLLALVPMLQKWPWTNTRPESWRPNMAWRSPLARWSIRRPPPCPAPCVLKPLDEGSSVGLALLHASRLATATQRHS